MRSTFPRHSLLWITTLLSGCGQTADADAGTGLDAASHDAATWDAGRADAAPSSDTPALVDGSVGCGASGAATGDLFLTALDGAGRERTYEVLVPAGYDPSVPIAITFVYHGAGGDESAARGFGFQDHVGNESILVFPRGIPFEGFGVGWNDRCDGYDMPFFDAMLASLEASYCIDRDRVFVAGFSWGGDQTTALLCCRGDRIRAAAPASCTDELGDPADPSTYANLPCPVANHAAIRFTHATDGDGPYPAPLFATTSALYRSFAGCSETSTSVASPCVAFDGCDSPYVECPYDGLGHSVPSGWAADTWSFFASVP